MDYNTFTHYNIFFDDESLDGDKQVFINLPLMHH